jgi:hypothetical protein
MWQYSQLPSKGVFPTIRSFRFAMSQVYALRSGVQCAGQTKTFFK